MNTVIEPTVNVGWCSRMASRTTPGFEPVVDHQRARREQCDRHVADQAGDMEQRRDPEHGVLGGEAHPVPVGLGVEHHRAVGAHRALRHAGGARGVAQHGHVVGTRIDGRRLAAVVLLKISSRSSVPSGRNRSTPANSRSSLRDWPSSGEQVITVLTAVSPVAMTSLPPTRTGRQGTAAPWHRSRRAGRSARGPCSSG